MEFLAKAVILIRIVIIIKIYDHHHDFMINYPHDHHQHLHDFVPNLPHDLYDDHKYGIS